MQLEITGFYSENFADGFQYCGLTEETNPLNYQHPFDYNRAEELTTLTDYNGQVQQFSYNEAGWNTGEEWLNSSNQVIYQSTLGYDNAGDLILAQDNNSLYNITYNSGGQLTGGTVTYPGYSSSPLVTLGFTYDAFGNRSSMTDSLGGSMGYKYNGENQMTGMSLGINGTTDASLTMNYDGLARLSGTTMSTPSGATIASTNSYDNASRLTNINYTNGGSTLASYNYTYNAASEITNYQDNSGNTLTYGYDYSGELTSATGTLAASNYNQTWSYDANGNRTMPGYSTGTGNQLLSDGVNNYTYDKNGNTLTQTNIATGTVTNYTWDYANRLTEVKVVNSSGTVLNDEKFTCDIFGNRIGVSLNGTQTLYTVYDGSNPYMDFNGSGQLTERYLYNPDALNQFYGQVNASGTTEWFVTDNLNSIRQVLSANGAALSTIVYDPFGQLLSSLNTSDPRFLYTGGAYDAITGMYTDGAREENPATGRWMSQDPLGFAAGDRNLYRYAINSPSNFIDPSGLDTKTWEGKIWIEKIDRTDVWMDYKVSMDYGCKNGHAWTKAPQIISSSVQGTLNSYGFAVQIGYWVSHYVKVEYDTETDSCPVGKKGEKEKVTVNIIWMQKADLQFGWGVGKFGVGWGMTNIYDREIGRVTKSFTIDCCCQ